VQPQEGGQENNHKAFVTVYGYRHEFGPVQINEILAQAEKGSQAIEVEAEVISEVEPEVESEAIKEVEKEEKETPGKKEKKKTPAEMKEPPEEFYLEQQKAEKEGEDGS